MMKIAQVTPELVANTWVLLQRTPHTSIWHKLEGKTWDHYVNAMRVSPFVMMFSFGVVRVDHVVVDHSLRIHPMFWSKDVFKSVEELKAGIEDLFSMPLDRIECVTPAKFGAIARLLFDCGFRPEGTMRKFFKIEDDGKKKLLDATLWSIVK